MIDASEKAKNNGITLFIVDAALLIEAGFNDFFNSILLITADKSMRYNRILLRNNIPESQIEKRMALQIPGYSLALQTIWRNPDRKSVV